MIVLDTNVLSEITRSAPNVDVMTWMAMQPSELLFTTSVSQAEMFFGIRTLPSGRRRDQMEATAKAIFADLVGRVLPFDRDAADVYADICAYRKSIGRPIRELDAQIASIALSRGASLATRNVRDFVEIDLDVVDPWTATA